MKNRLSLFLIAVLQLSFLYACKKESVTPDIKFNRSLLTIVEDNPAALVEIPVSLTGTFDKAASLDYSTEDSTAFAGKDYAAVTSGKLTFQPGETQQTIKINILPDTANKQDVYFRVIFSNPVNVTLSKTSVTVKIVNVDYAILVWSDEFNSASLNTSTWNYELGAGGWGNNELETYTNSVNNVHIDSGYLHITALNPSGSYYTSGRITTQGKKEFTYGRIRIRAKLPEGQGLWPALWMLGANFSTAGWPKCGEIDIMELLGKAPSVVYGTIHWDAGGYTSRSNSYALTGGSFSTGFHTFTLVWTPFNLNWLVDDKMYSSLSRSEVNAFPFDLPQFFIFNVAVGGNWPGNPDQTTVFPQHMIVDYIRVYQ
jgi:Glycosyl hydrolases family 16/Calx-beta domain